MDFIGWQLAISPCLIAAMLCADGNGQDVKKRE
jgi:hypothetical protein